MPFPSAEEFVEHAYNGAGQCLDCADTNPELRRFYEGIRDAAEAPQVGGARQIKFPLGSTDEQAVNACYDTVNSMALSNPEWSQKIGHSGMMKLQAACYYEATGAAPVGYMQQVADAIDLKSSGVPQWAWLAVGAAAVLLLLRSR